VYDRYQIGVNHTTLPILEKEREREREIERQTNRQVDKQRKKRGEKTQI